MAGKQTNRLVKLLPEWARNYTSRRPMTRYNPTKTPGLRNEPESLVYTMFRYGLWGYQEKTLDHDTSCTIYQETEGVLWLNIDGLKRDEVERVGNNYGIHSLLMEDILSVGQRAKIDEADNVIFCLLPMLYYNEGTGMIEAEQVSIVLGKNFVISFQEDKERDVFDPIRQRIRNGQPKLRYGGADYLCYSLIDIIVDSYFNIIDKLNERIERLEDALLLQKEKTALSKISILRREVMMMRRSVWPVRDVVTGFMRSESQLLQKSSRKYFKDVHDHIMQAGDYTENHREMLMNLQDLSMSQINLRMNEVMKVFTLLATLMAPATVIGGIFGMNFDVIPLAHQQEGFYITVSIMLVIPLLMMIYFKRRGWF